MTALADTPSSHGTAQKTILFFLMHRIEFVALDHEAPTTGRPAVNGYGGSASFSTQLRGISFRLAISMYLSGPIPPMNVTARPRSQLHCPLAHASDSLSSSASAHHTRPTAHRNRHMIGFFAALGGSWLRLTIFMYMNGPIPPMNVIARLRGQLHCLLARTSDPLSTTRFRNRTDRPLGADFFLLLNLVLYADFSAAD